MTNGAIGQYLPDLVRHFNLNWPFLKFDLDLWPYLTVTLWLCSDIMTNRSVRRNLSNLVCHFAITFYDVEITILSEGNVLWSVENNLKVEICKKIIIFFHYFLIITFLSIIFNIPFWAKKMCWQWGVQNNQKLEEY